MAAGLQAGMSCGTIARAGRVRAICAEYPRFLCVVCAIAGQAWITRRCGWRRLRPDWQHHRCL